jgi:hypothetical protein
VSATYNSAAKCGYCIENDNVFCYVGNTEGEVVEEGATYPTNYCCETYDSTTFACTRGSSSTVTLDSSYICSDGYTDADFAKSVCPQRKSKCGS